MYESRAMEIHKLSSLFSSASGDELDSFANFLDRVVWNIQTRPTSNDQTGFDFQEVLNYASAFLTLCESQTLAFESV